MRGSFGKVILAHKGITKPPAYSRIQAVFNVFRGKRTKPKPNLLYDGHPNDSLIFIHYNNYSVVDGKLYSRLILSAIIAINSLFVGLPRSA